MNVPLETAPVCGVRPAIDADFGPITAIYNKSMLAREACSHPQPITEGKCRQWLSDPKISHLLLVAEVPNDGPIAGWAALLRYHPRLAYATTGELIVYIDPARRGCGAGTALATQAISNARRLNLHSLITFCSGCDSKTLGWTKSLGFETRGQITLPHSDELQTALVIVQIVL